MRILPWHCQLFPGFHCHIIDPRLSTSHQQPALLSPRYPQRPSVYQRLPASISESQRLLPSPKFSSPSYLEPTPAFRIVSTAFLNPTTRPQLFLPSRHAVIDKKANRNNKTAGSDTRGPIQQLSSNANFGPSPITHTIYTHYPSITSTCFVFTFLQAHHGRRID